MKKQRRIFTAEFKQEAASMVLDQQRAVSEVCQALAGCLSEQHYRTSGLFL